MLKCYLNSNRRFLHFLLSSLHFASLSGMQTWRASWVSLQLGDFDFQAWEGIVHFSLSIFNILEEFWGFAHITKLLSYQRLPMHRMLRRSCSSIIKDICFLLTSIILNIWFCYQLNVTHCTLYNILCTKKILLGRFTLETSLLNFSLKLVNENHLTSPSFSSFGPINCTLL